VKVATKSPGAEQFYAFLVESGDLCLDIGANIGVHARAMLAAGGQVVAVEPQAALAEQLRADGRFTVVERVVMDWPTRKIALWTSSQHPHLATISTGWRIESGEPEGTWDGVKFVPTTTLEELIREHGVPKLLKIDTEGAEHLVLDTLKDPIERILFEVHGKLPTIAEQCFDIIEARGADYEYRLMAEESWQLSAPMDREQILDELPRWGDVYAERKP
jgi:FkbM family methyltransferase